MPNRDKTSLDTVNVGSNLVVYVPFVFAARYCGYGVVDSVAEGFERSSKVFANRSVALWCFVDAPESVVDFFSTRTAHAVVFGRNNERFYKPIQPVYVGNWFFTLHHV
jgi:hypothetical protein